MTTGGPFASIVDLLPEPTIVVSADGVIRAVNEAAARRFGSTAGALVGTSLFEHAAEAAQLQAYLRECAASRQPLPGALAIPAEGSASERTRCQGWLILPRAGDTPAVIGLRLLGTDAAVRSFAKLTRQIGELTAEISRRRRAESRLEAALQAQTALQQRFAALAEAPATLLASLTIKDVHEALGSLSRRMIPADAHALWHFDSESRIWRVAWKNGLSDAFVSEIADWQGTATGAVPFETPFTVPDVSRVPLLADRLDTYRREGITSLLAVPLRIRGENHGTIVAYFRTPATFDDGVHQVATALGNLGSSALTTATLYEFESEARRAVELAEHRARFLAGAGAALAESLDYQDTLRTVADLAIPEFADWCTVDMLDEDGEVERLAIAHVDPMKRQLADALRRQYPPKPSAAYGVHHVLQTKQPVLLSRIPETLIEEGAEDGEHLQLLKSLGLRSYMSVPLTVHGRAIGVISFVSSRSTREYNEDDLRLAEDVASRAALAVENARSYEEARRANQLKDDFLATLSHELRTPLNAILGYVRMLRSGALEAGRLPRALEVVERNATALNQMVEDILDVSRVIAGKVRLEVQPVELPLVVQDAIATVTPAAEAKGIRIQTRIGTDAPPVSGDPARLQQVIWNLLSNAVKFTPRGGRVDVVVERAGSQVEIVVSDTGIGVTPAFLPHIFDRFRQADARFSREYGGLGLGLAIARHYVELHGGEISAESDGPDRGTTFRISLPALIDAVAPGAVPLTAAEQAAAAIAGLHVLAVDDEPDSRALLAEVLRSAGARVTLAGSVLEALQALEREMPDVMVADIGMPGMDGYELVARVRESSDLARKNLPIAALTAYARAEDRVRAIESGFQIHVSKPIDPRALVAVVRDLARRTGEPSS